VIQALISKKDREAPMPDHRFHLGDRVRIERSGAGSPLESLIDRHLPRDDMIYTVARRVHVGTNPSTTEPTKVLVFLVVEKGQPPAVPVN
jgi:hypothetical protein